MSVSIAGHRVCFVLYDLLLLYVIIYHAHFKFLLYNIYAVSQ